MPTEIRAALGWLRRSSLPITALRDDKTVRQVLDVLAVKLNGTPASPDYLGRRRRVLYNVLGYAVRENRLTENPLDSTTWEVPDVSVAEINPRVVASPEQVRELPAAVSYIGPRRGERLVAFFACLYFADLRHGGISLRLNAGVPATQVAEWAGHSVEVLLTIYAKCIEGRDQVWFDRIDRWLGD